MCVLLFKGFPSSCDARVSEFRLRDVFSRFAVLSGGLLGVLGGLLVRGDVDLPAGEGVLRHGGTLPAGRARNEGRNSLKSSPVTDIRNVSL